ncbi:DUF1549 domain-containing protein [Acidicapsa acidisoli]|uniref:DUF1549 domain-containing protein n=1 Tax=Acidicapsa acidisoli TaxID=1615681 RepID=UPI0021E0215C|nr:DUF1549 domain-containing protein [Acidicapsa acidisoli]
MQSKYLQKFLPVVAFVAMLGGIPAPRSALASAPGQAAAVRVPNDAPFHPAGTLKPEATTTDNTAPPPKPVTSLATLTRIEILPASVVISGPRNGQRLLVEGTFADGHQEDLTSRSTFTISDSKVANVDKDRSVDPQADGQATITASLAGHRATAPLTVKDYRTASTWSFRNDVLPVMTKMGCNSGPCHGAAAGKNGFKLTLRGYDPVVDYYTLTHQANARRTDRIEPAHSLILLKPTLTIPHGGGRRFDVNSPEYKVIAGWLAQGMPAPLESDPRVTEIRVLPAEASLRIGAEQQLIVTAVFSDGHTADVTRWSKFDSGDEGVASVDGNGHVIMRGYGEAPVTVWYQSHVTFSRLRIPFPRRLEQVVFTKAPRHNFIDDAILKHLAILHIPPSPPASDAEFLRRAYLDAAGILPTPSEADAFLKDASPDKRNKLIDALLKLPEFVDYWAYKWSDLLLVSSNHLSSDEMWSYYNWIRESVANDTPWNKFAAQIVTATGNTLQNGAANYWLIHRDPLDTSENMAQAFMGINISCAHCHNHPLAKWTQKDYYGMANLFARVRLKTFAPSGFRTAVGPLFNNVTVYSAPTGEFMDDRLMIPLPPKPLDAAALSSETPGDTRQYFAKWLTSPENPFFARNIVNRVWRNFMGRGLIEPVDDLRDTNPATNEELLDALVKDFIAHDYDVDYLVRTIMQSATYQTSSRPLKENVDDEKYGSHYLIKRLPAEVLLDAYSQITQVPEKFDGYPVGMRGMQLPDTAVKSYFLTAFGRPVRQQTRESERSSVPTITQALHIINGDTLNNKLRASGSSLDMLIRLGFSDDQIVDYLYRSAFSRPATDSERTALVQGLASAEQEKVAGMDDPRRAALIDLSWALLTSKEFMFNH